MDKPIAFFSYAHRDDQNGRLSKLREHLSAEVSVQTGADFEIFQDRLDIRWGQNWKERIETSLNEVVFLIPVITPSFFTSQSCRNELQQFLKREKDLDRNDLILPIYYVDSPLLNNAAKRATDELAQAVHAHQYVDWRKLRDKPWHTAIVKTTLTSLAVQIRDALDRVQETRQTNVEVDTISSKPIQEGTERSEDYYKRIERVVDKPIERVKQLPVEEFFRGMSFLAERWWKDESIGERVRQMQRSYDEKLSAFRDQSRSLRPELIALKDMLLQEHPETADDETIGRAVTNAVQHQNLDLSLRRFDELAAGADLEGDELPRETAYNSLPDREAWTEEPTPERQMLNIINARLNHLWHRRNQGGPRVGNVQEKYTGLDQRHNAAVQQFVEWKRGTPEGAMRELLATAKALDRDIPEDAEPKIDVQMWQVSLWWPLLSNDYPEQARITGLIELYKGLLDRAAEGLY